MAATGRNCLQFDLSRGDFPEWAQPPVRVIPGEVLSASCAWRVEQAFSVGHAAVLLRFWRTPDRSGNALEQVIIQDEIGTTRTPGWRTSSVTATVPLNAVYADLTCWGGGLAQGPQGVAYFDEVSLRVVEEPAASINLAPSDGLEGVRSDVVVECQVNVAAPAKAMLRLGEDRLALGTADGTGVSALLLPIPVANGTARQSLSLLPNRKFYWRVDVMTPDGQWMRGQTTGFSTGPALAPAARGPAAAMVSTGVAASGGDSAIAWSPFSDAILEQRLRSDGKALVYVRMRGNQRCADFEKHLLGPEVSAIMAGSPALFIDAGDPQWAARLREMSIIRFPTLAWSNGDGRWHLHIYNESDAAKGLVEYLRTYKSATARQ